MKTVFVVDDSDTNLMVVKLALKDLYRTFAVPSAERMFKLMEKITPDLILLDVEMPEMDGFSAMERLKSHEQWKNIPVAFLSASEDERVRADGMEMGAVDFISKPFKDDELIQRIDDILG